MSKAAKNTQLKEWEAESLRLTAFTREDLALDQISWWRDLIEEDPDSTKSKPKLGTRKDEGEFCGGHLTLSFSPNRIDWLYTWKYSEDSDGLPTIGNFDDYCQKFTSIMSKWLLMAPPIFRLAFGAVLLKPMDSREMAYREISKLLPHVEIDIENARDFLYQINRPLKSTVFSDSNHMVNRLSKWAVMRFQPLPLRMQISQDTGEVTNTSIPGDEIYVCRLELDISTDQKRSENFSSEKLGECFLELESLGKEIVENGDIK